MKAQQALRPLAALIALAILLIAVAAIARAITSRAGFLIERPVVLLVFVIGLVIASTVFAWVAQRSWRRNDSPLSLWSMIVAILVLASPLALMLLQHPAR